MIQRKGTVVYISNKMCAKVFHLGSLHGRLAIRQPFEVDQKLTSQEILEFYLIDYNNRILKA